MTKLSAQSALAHLHGDSDGVSFRNAGIALQEIPLLGMVRLQGPGDDAEFCNSVEALTIPLPGPCQSSGDDKLRCLWLTPKEWLFITPCDSESALVQRLAPALQGKLAIATPISDSRLALAVSGSKASQLLSKGCSLDLHHRQFIPGKTAVTRFAKVACMLTRTETDRFELVVDRSQAHYIWGWLVDAAGEFD